jgi:cell division protein YceG involved in septum cleavage
MPVNNPSKYPLRVSTPRSRFVSLLLQSAVLVVVLAVSGLFLLPQIVTLEVKHEQDLSLSHPVQIASNASVDPFPVSVNPATKTIVNNPQATAVFAAQTGNGLGAAVGNVSEIISYLASLIDSSSIYEGLAAAEGHLIVIKPGDRKEQVLAQLTKALNWNKSEQQQFLTDVSAQTPGVTEGIFAPGNYVVDDTMTPANVAALINVKFDETVLDHYSTTTASQVPLSEALTVASMIERESGGPDDMRLISGIIWNRLFNNMNLQIDATLQYAMGESRSGNWWQQVLPKDKYVSSPYNTYAHPGLPPGPISDPSVAAVIAALNPVKTSCIYYFHDSHGNIHCSSTYAQHVALLKKYYGQGK